MDLHCVVQGYPHAKVTWYKGKEEINGSTEGSKYKIRKFLGDFQNVKESFGDYQIDHLHIQSVEFSDAGDYTCEAYSEHFNITDKKTLTVRVKGKFYATPIVLTNDKVYEFATLDDNITPTFKNI